MINWVEKVNDVKSISDEWNGIFLPNIGEGVVELRRTFSKDSHYAQMLIRIRPNDVIEISMNGKASIEPYVLFALPSVVIEAQTKLALAGD